MKPAIQNKMFLQKNGNEIREKWRTHNLQVHFIMSKYQMSIFSKKIFQKLTSI
jgi:hypothetical protein